MWWIKVSFLQSITNKFSAFRSGAFVDVIFIFIIKQEHTAQFCSLDESVLIAESQNVDFRQSKLTDFYFLLNFVIPSIWRTSNMFYIISKF